MWRRVASSAAERLVADPVAGAGPAGGSAVARIGKAAAVERETAAADAFGETEFEPLQLGDSLIYPLPPRARELSPVAARRGALGGELGQFGADFLERQPYSLGEDDESDAPQHRARKAAVPRPGSLRRDEPSLLIEAEGGCGDTAPPRDLSDSQQLGHETSRPQRGIDFKFTSTSSVRTSSGPMNSSGPPGLDEENRRPGSVTVLVPADWARLKETALSDGALSDGSAVSDGSA